MRIIVGGSRTFCDFRLLERKLNRMTEGKQKVTVITGGQGGRQGPKGELIGADALAEWWAYLHHHTVEVYHADWKENGKSAGPIRNTEMIKNARAKRAIFFWDGQSPGTKDCIEKAKKAGLKVKVVMFGEKKNEGFGV